MELKIVSGSDPYLAEIVGKKVSFKIYHLVRALARHLGDEDINRVLESLLLWGRGKVPRRVLVGYTLRFHELQNLLKRLEESSNVELRHLAQLYLQELSKVPKTVQSVEELRKYLEKIREEIYNILRSEITKQVTELVREEEEKEEQRIKARISRLEGEVKKLENELNPRELRNLALFKQMLNRVLEETGLLDLIKHAEETPSLVYLGPYWVKWSGLVHGSPFGRFKIVNFPLIVKEAVERTLLDLVKYVKEGRNVTISQIRDILFRNILTSLKESGIDLDKLPRSFTSFLRILIFHPDKVKLSANVLCAGAFGSPTSFPYTFLERYGVGDWRDYIGHFGESWGILQPFYVPNPVQYYYNDLAFTILKRGNVNLLALAVPYGDTYLLLPIAELKGVNVPEDTFLLLPRALLSHLSGWSGWTALFNTLSDRSIISREVSFRDVDKLRSFITAVRSIVQNIEKHVREIEQEKAKLESELRQIPRKYEHVKEVEIRRRMSKVEEMLDKLIRDTLRLIVPLYKQYVINIRLY